MVADATLSQSQPPSAEEEALKRNTDCVYFLASPLTCKKGNECEYRHSESARVNPRDCWFWLNGNCLNPKCAFRHPPLDGLLGAQPSSTGPSAPIPQNVATPVPHVPSTSTKQQGGVACIYFQKGYCLKGDWCPFLHVPNSFSNKASSVPGAAPTAEPSATNKKVFTNNTVQQKKTSSMNVVKSVKDPPKTKPTNVVEHALLGNEFALNRRGSQASDITEFPRYRNASPIPNGNPINWSSRAQQPRLPDEPESMDRKDAEEVSREHSPGFDVLVDDDRRDSDYYTGEDRYGMSVEHEAMNEYNIDHSTDYDTIAAVDDERFDYESNENHNGGRYAWEQHITPSERMSGRSYPEKRPYDSLGQVDGSDLRYRLAKNRKPNGLRSVISHEHVGDIQAGERSYHNLPRHDNSLSSRLRGRIRMPGRLSPTNDRDMIRGASRGRVDISSQPRGKGLVDEAFNNDGGNYRGHHLRREENSSDFAAPKSLAELKNRKTSDRSGQNSTDQQSIGKRKHEMLDFQLQGGECDLSFEGPKPLEEILKRKRGETVDENENQERKDSMKNEIQQSAAAQKTDIEETKIGASNSPNKLETEEGILGDDGVVQESEAVDHDGGEEFDVYDGENEDGNGEYLEEEEEDDDDEFAKKMGVVYS